MPDNRKKYYVIIKNDKPKHLISGNLPWHNFFSF